MQAVGPRERPTPTVSELPTNTIAGVEALVRWVHPDRGLIPPLEFIPVAEEPLLITDLGRLVVREACAQGRRWLDLETPGPSS